MGNCFSSGDKQTERISSEKPTTYKRTKPVNTSQGRTLSNNNNNNNGGSTNNQQIDPQKAAAEAAEKRLREQKIKDGKLGQKLAQTNAKSTQQTLNEKAKQELNSRKDTQLIYD